MVAKCVWLKQKQVVALCCPSKEIPDHNIQCFAMLWSPLDIFFPSKAIGARSGGPCKPFSWPSTTCILQVDSLTVSMASMCNISQCFHSCDQFSANKQSAHCLYKYYPNMRRLPALPEEQGANRCTRRGAELRLGIKMPTLHYGWSTSLLLAAWGWGSDQSQSQSWLSSWLLC